MLYVFIVCLTFGVGYTAVSAILGSHGFDHSAFDHGGVHVGGHGHGSSDSAEAPSPFNPLVIASAIATFGGVGLIAKAGFGMSDFISTAAALIFAGGIGAAIFFGIVKFMYGSQSNSTFSLNDLIETEAEVITPIPEKGMGEIAYVANGVRYNLSAKSYYNKSISRGAMVSIKEIQGSTAIVAQRMNIEQYGLEEEEIKKVFEKEKE